MTGRKVLRLVGSYLELDVFAGAPNPRWQVSAQAMDLIRSRIQDLPRRDVHREALELWEPVSGYGGVLLRFYGPHGDLQTFRVYRQLVVDEATGIVWADDERRLEQELVGTMPRHQAELIDYVPFGILAQELDEIESIQGVDAGTAPSCSGALAYPPLQQWLTSPGKHDNHCYNYANDVFATLTAVPGAQLHYDMTALELHNHLVSDGLVPASSVNNTVLPTACHPRADAHLLAACQRLKNPHVDDKIEGGVTVPTFRDFHFLRFDATGKWSHKDGAKPPRNTDNKGKVLTDLAAAKFKLKHYWVGYYWTYPGPHRRIREPGP